MQLLLFQPSLVTITYWHYPFNSNGNYNRKLMSLFTETLPEHLAPGMVNMLITIGAKNIKSFKN